MLRLNYCDHIHRNLNTRPLGQVFRLFRRGSNEINTGGLILAFYNVSGSKRNRTENTSKTIKRRINSLYENGVSLS